MTIMLRAQHYRTSHLTSASVHLLCKIHNCCGVTCLVGRNNISCIYWVRVLVLPRYLLNTTSMLPTVLIFLPFINVRHIKSIWPICQQKLVSFRLVSPPNSGAKPQWWNLLNRTQYLPDVKTSSSAIQLRTFLLEK